MLAPHPNGSGDERVGRVVYRQVAARSPAQGTTTESGKPVHDEIVIFEVMTEVLDVSWWTNYRLHLERDFRQDQIVIRASTITPL